MKKMFVKKTASQVMILLLAGTVLLSCAAPAYILHEESAARQKKLKNTRTANIALDAFITAGSVLVAAFTGVYINYVPENRQFSRVAIINPSEDTINVNMLTDLLLKDSTFCDFNGIVIPPGEKIRLLVPRGAAYHVYFSNTPEPDDDEMIGIHCDNKKKISLSPGMTRSEKDRL